MTLVCSYEIIAGLMSVSRAHNVQHNFHRPLGVSDNNIVIELPDWSPGGPCLLINWLSCSGDLFQQIAARNVTLKAFKPAKKNFYLVRRRFSTVQKYDEFQLEVQRSGDTGRAICEVQVEEDEKEKADLWRIILVQESIL